MFFSSSRRSVFQSCLGRWLLLWVLLLLGSFLQPPVGVQGLNLFNRSARRARQMQELILTRRTINEFEPELPPNWSDALQKGIHAATFAPNHKRTEPWRFHLLGPQSIPKVCQLNAQLVTKAKGPAAGEKKLQRWLAMPGWLVVTCCCPPSPDATLDDPTSLAREDYAACCCAVQNLSLSLHAQGLGTKWTTGPVNFHPDFHAAAGIPENEYVVGTLWFGTPASQPSPPLKKLSLESVFIQHD